MASRRVPAWLLLVLLPLAFGAGSFTRAGTEAYRWYAVQQRRWMARQYQQEMTRRLMEVPDSLRRAFEQTRAQREADARERLAKRPLEVARLQVGQHCAVSYLVRGASPFDSLQLASVGLGPGTLLWARAHEPPAPRRPFELSRPAQPSAPLAEAWLYRLTAWRPGDTLTFVLPNVVCDEGLMVSWGALPARIGRPAISVVQR